MGDPVPRWRYRVVIGLLARFVPTEVRVLSPSTSALCSSPDCDGDGPGCVNCYECFSRAATDDTARASREWNLRAFERRRSALNSQYPMLVLMVLYTLVSLWILAQPIVE